MFDLRYHVASLAAVFLALIIGILVGVGISGRGLISEGERRQLNAEIDRLRGQLDELRVRVREQEADEKFVEETYAAVMADRLGERNIAIVFVGSVDLQIRANVEETLERASGRRLRLRAIKVPLDVPEVEAALPPDTGAVRLRGRDHMDDLGRILGEELVVGGQTPLWDAVSELIVEQQSGGSVREADGVVVARSTTPQSGETARFLSGLYNGLASAGVPAVAVERTDTDSPDLQVFQDAGFSTVNNIDSPIGRLALALLLGGESTGDYGLNADDGYLPSVPIVPPAPRGT